MHTRLIERKIVIVVLGLASLMILGCGKLSEFSKSQGRMGASATGNGAPSGKHVNLNIIGVPYAKNVNMDLVQRDLEKRGKGGKVIFIPLQGKTTIQLVEGAFEVVDKDGTDGVAIFSLPNPDPDDDGKTEYSVYASPKGKPGGKLSMQTCGTLLATGEYLCSTEPLEVGRTKGKSKFTNVSRQLLYIWADLDLDGVSEHYNLFHDSFTDFLWEVYNTDLRLLQLRFYDESTDVNLVP